MSIFLCIRKKQKKNKHNDILIYHYINCKYCNERFTNDIEYSCHLYICSATRFTNIFWFYCKLYWFTGWSCS